MILLYWILRIAVALTFIGHGYYAFILKPEWHIYLLTVGIKGSYIPLIMKTIGVLDFLVALIIILKPIPLVLYWAVFWTLITALIRPLSGEGIAEAIERGSNVGASLALAYVHAYINKKSRQSRILKD